MATQYPIPQNPIGENFAWRDWFQKLSNRVFGTLVSQDSHAVDITGGTIDGTAIGSTTPSTASVTSLVASTLKVTSLTGYMKAHGTGIVTASSTVPNTDVTGLGTMSTQNTGATGTFVNGSHVLTIVNGIVTNIT